MKTTQNSQRQLPLVSIITINYDETESTLELIASLQEIQYPAVEIIVVDNASPESPLAIQEEFPGVILIQNGKNMGFAAANNQGIRRASGKYILLLNNDVVVTPDFLEPMVQKLESNPEIGAISPKIRFYNEPNLIQYAGYTPMNLVTMRNHAIGYRQEDNGQYNQSRSTAFAHGAAMMLPISVIREIGMMSEMYFLYYEELDWSYRIRKAGYKIWYQAESMIHHKGSLTTARLGSLKAYYLQRNRLLFVRRNLGGPAFIISVVYHLLIAYPKAIIASLLSKQSKNALACIKGLFWHIVNIANKEIQYNPSYFLSL